MAALADESDVEAGRGTDRHGLAGCGPAAEAGLIKVR
jgi:hypothetical protein